MSDDTAWPGWTADDLDHLGAHADLLRATEHATITTVAAALCCARVGAQLERRSGETHVAAVRSFLNALPTDWTVGKILASLRADATRKGDDS